MFPLSLIPVFAVPLSILLHFASLQKLGQDQKAGHRSLRTDRMIPGPQSQGFESSGESNMKRIFGIQR
jgi:hypothetical protein